MNRSTRLVTAAAVLAAAAVDLKSWAQPETALPEVGPVTASLIAEAPLEPVEDESAVDSLLKQTHNAALAETRIRYQEYRAGVSDGSESIFDAAVRLRKAKIELASDAEAKRETLRFFVDLAKEFESLAQTRLQYGGGSPAALERLRYERLRLELELLRASPGSGGAGG